MMLNYEHEDDDKLELSPPTVQTCVMAALHVAIVIAHRIQVVDGVVGVRLRPSVWLPRRQIRDTSATVRARQVLLGNQGAHIQASDGERDEGVEFGAV